MTEFAGALLATAMIAAALMIGIGIRRIVRGGRDERFQAILMVVAGLVLVANVAILAWPVG